jgi:hypothetical protein
VLFYLHSSVWFTNPVGTNLVMFNLYKKKTQRREINEVRSRALGHFFEFSRVFFFIAYVGREKKDDRLVGFVNCPLGSSQELQNTPQCHFKICHF